MGNSLLVITQAVITIIASNNQRPVTDKQAIATRYKSLKKSENHHK